MMYRGQSVLGIPNLLLCGVFYTAFGKRKKDHRMPCEMIQGKILSNLQRRNLYKCNPHWLEPAFCWPTYSVQAAARLRRHGPFLQEGWCDVSRPRWREQHVTVCLKTGCSQSLYLEDQLIGSTLEFSSKLTHHSPHISIDKFCYLAYLMHICGSNLSSVALQNWDNC